MSRAGRDILPVGRDVTAVIATASEALEISRSSDGPRFRGDGLLCMGETHLAAGRGA